MSRLKMLVLYKSDLFIYMFDSFIHSTHNAEVQIAHALTKGDTFAMEIWSLKYIAETQLDSTVISIYSQKVHRLCPIA